MGSNKDMMELLAIEEAGNHPRARSGDLWAIALSLAVGWIVIPLVLGSFVIFLLIVPIFAGVLSVYVTSLLLWHWPPLIPVAMFWFLGLLLLLMAVRVLALVVRYGWLGMKIYGIYFAAVTVVGLIGSFTGLFGFLDSWSESVSRGLLQDLAGSVEDIPAWGIGFIGFDLRSIVEGTTLWFKELDQDLMGVFLFTVCAMFISEIGLLGSAAIKRGETMNRERKEDAELARNRGQVSTPAPTGMQGVSFTEGPAVVPAPQPENYGQAASSKPARAQPVDRPVSTPTPQPANYGLRTNPSPAPARRPAETKPSTTNIPSPLLNARAHLRDGNPGRAIDIATEVLRHDTGNIAAYRIRAAAFVERREFGRAISDCEQALKTKPNDKYSRELLAFARSKVYR